MANYFVFASIHSRKAVAATQSSCARQLRLPLLSTPAMANAPSKSSPLNEEVRKTMACLSGDLTHLTGAPLQSPEVFHRYCVALRHYFEAAPTRTPVATVPMFVGTAADDTIVPTQAAQRIAQLYGRTEVFLEPRGGHFAPCTCPELWAALRRFLSSVAHSSDEICRRVLAA